MKYSRMGMEFVVSRELMSRVRDKCLVLLGNGYRSDINGGIMSQLKGRLDSYLEWGDGRVVDIDIDKWEEDAVE